MVSKIPCASIFVGLALLFSVAQAQTPNACTVLGQTPASAFPICASDTFHQQSVPICTNHNMAVSGCTMTGGVSYADKNPFWYQFTCYQAGTLGFLITPNNLGDDYDWQLFDITGVTDLNAVYTNPALFVVANWSGSYGLTGASAAGQHSVECASDPADNINTFSIMPVITAGHTYLLMVSHFSDSQSGYSLSFGGGTAVIKNPKPPGLRTVTTSCDSKQIRLKLDAKVLCKTLAGNGSDFSISPSLATVVSASSPYCSYQFDMDSIVIVLSNSLPIGNYSLVVKKGSDGNTLLDACDRAVVDNSSIGFTIDPVAPALPDSIPTPACSPRQLNVFFSKNISCASVAAGGSDFVITGPSPVTVSNAVTACTGGLSNSVTLQLAGPILKGGLYRLQLVKGTDGNTVIDECGIETPAGSSFDFMASDTVSAAFTYNVLKSCAVDTVHFSHDGKNGVNQWLWLLGGAGVSGLQSPSAVYTSFDPKQISLTVSNGVCRDSVTETIALGNELAAAFKAEDMICPQDAAVFSDSSKGDITAYYWNFGNGNTSIAQNPPPQYYPRTGAETKYIVQLVVQNRDQCYDTASSVVTVLKSCFIAVPNAFTPNNDGNNDFLYPLNALKADNLDFRIFNRFGQMVFHSTDRTAKWDGKINGQLQDTGVYVWMLSYTDHDSGKKVMQKGTTVLIR